MRDEDYRQMAHRPLRRMDQILTQDNLFRIDLLQCSQAAARMADCNWAVESTDAAGSRERAILIRLAVAAICHQFNWDFLTQSLTREIAADDEPVAKLANVDARQLYAWLEAYPKKERIRAKERAALLRDLGNELQDRYLGRAENLILDASKKLLGAKGLMRRLDDFEAFRQDPLRKKSNVFVHELVRERIARFEDEEAIDPAIDYHIMRIYLRTGRVVPKHRETLHILRSKQPTRPRLVKLLRQTVAEAVRSTAFYAALPVPDVNYIEWQLGRGVCTVNEPSCESGTRFSDPVITTLSESRCPYAEFCAALRDDRWLIAEPHYQGSFF